MIFIVLFPLLPGPVRCQIMHDAAAAAPFQNLKHRARENRAATLVRQLRGPHLSTCA
jgi:hypothetical protein